MAAAGLRRRGPLPAVRAVASVTPATVTFSIQNNTKLDAVYAFVTGQALDNGNALMLLLSVTLGSVH